MQLYLGEIDFLKLMIGEERRLSDPALQDEWDERSSAGYYFISQSLELNQHHHVMHMLPEINCVLEDAVAAARTVASIHERIELPQNQRVWTLEWVRTKILKTTSSVAMGCRGENVAEDMALVVVDAVQRRTTTPTTNKEVPVGVAVRNLDVGASRVLVAK
ncbi:unnamed protein product [Closterium sp. NIES-54]